MPYGPQSVLGDILRNPQAASVVRTYMPGLENEPMISTLLRGRLGLVTTMVQPIRVDPVARDAFYAELATVAETAVEEPPVEPEAVPSADYESADVPVGSARLVQRSSVRRWRPFEVELHGPEHGNPFTDVELRAEFAHGERTLTAYGFYDGEGVYRIRFMPDQEGDWAFRTSSNARSLDGITGGFTCDPAGPDDHGPVRVHERFHFRHADGTRILPLGTTAYDWTNQGDDLEKQTLQTLADSPFNKIRMGVFPKSFVYSTGEPPRFPFEGSPETGWDFQRPDPAYFRHLEERIEQLGDLGIEADLILFHPYDRWGFSDLGPAADDRYLRYLVARLAAHANVWWSLANEYDCMFSKDAAHWPRSAAVIRERDPHDHLMSVHNWVELYDNSADWVTHSSIQRGPEDTPTWREHWGKPVALDEMGYEGDIDWGWGNLTAQEMVRRCWDGVVRGGYVTHGECYLADGDILWWAKGGVLKGESAPRLEFLRTILEQTPSDAAGIDPLPGGFDFPAGGVEGRYHLTYFGAAQPGVRSFALRPGTRYRAEIIDTWNMTVTEVPGSYEGEFTLTLPGRPYIAVRLLAVAEDK
jgi:hypothetical protein